MVEITIKTNVDLINYYKKEKEQYLNRAGNEAKNILMENAPVDHGTLRNSWKKEIGEDSVTLTNSRAYSVPMYLGSGIYGKNHKRIVPKRKKALRFPAGGEIVYAKSTKGYNANGRWEKCLKQIQEKIRNIK